MTEAALWSFNGEQERVSEREKEHLRSLAHQEMVKMITPELLAGGVEQGIVYGMDRRIDR